MIDPVMTNRIARDHHRELLQQAERARLLRAARSAGQNDNQSGFKLRLQALVHRIFGAAASDQPAAKSESAPEERTTAA